MRTSLLNTVDKSFTIEDKELNSIREKLQGMVMSYRKSNIHLIGVLQRTNREEDKIKEKGKTQR